MIRLAYIPVALALVAAEASSENSTVWNEDTCEAQPWDTGPWSSLLEEWATSTPSHNSRHGRIMVLPPAQGYYVSDRIDLIPPPPPPPHHHHNPHHPPPPGPPQQHGPTPGHYEEWQVTPPPPPGAGKIVNRPPNPYIDKYKPGYPPPSYNQPIPVHGQYGQHGPPPSQTPPYTPVDRVDEHKPQQKPQQKPQKHVSETDLYLLTAIEKLVYRVDLMEKRLRKMEENVHYIVAGSEVKPEPCVANFTRVGSGCYHFSTDALNWKNANYACRKLSANLLELDSDTERRHMFSYMLAEKRLKGGDWWTGGLNPGLLWIWAHSAKPIVTNATTNSSSSSPTIVGDGRCLALTHDPAVNNIVYRGQDCSLRHRFACEKTEEKEKLGNEIARVAKSLKHLKTRKAKMGWTDEGQ